MSKPDSPTAPATALDGDDEQTLHYIVELIDVIHRKAIGLDPDHNCLVDLKTFERPRDVSYVCNCGRSFDDQDEAGKHLREHYLDDPSTVLSNSTTDES